jgi:hypothetical protein
MKSFNQWMLEEADAQPNAQPTDNSAVSVPEHEAGDISPVAPSPSGVTPKAPVKYHIKPWKASKVDILNFWRSIGASIPLQLKPIDYEHEGSTIQEDGIRITGSKEFITSVLSRLKDFLSLENPDTKLMVAYRQSPKSFIPGNKNSYIFYLQTKKRGKKI